MPSSATTNYQLSQWEASDKVLRTDFNADNAKIDAAIKALENKADMKANQLALTNEITARANGDSNLNTRVNAVNTALAKKGNCEIYYMSYVGDGQDTKTLTFPKKPLAVFIMGDNCFCRHIPGAPYMICSAAASYGVASPARWSGNSLTWNTSSDPSGNAKNTAYYVVALIDAAT